jgi:hypothetical protein
LKVGGLRIHHGDIITSVVEKDRHLKSDKSPFKEYIKHTDSILYKLVEYYRKSDGHSKRKILGCIFSKKIVLEKSRVATYEFTTPINVLINGITSYCCGERLLNGSYVLNQNTCAKP